MDGQRAVDQDQDRSLAMLVVGDRRAVVGGERMHASSVDGPGSAILRLPLLVAPLPGNRPDGCGILGSSWVLRLAISRSARPVVQCGTGAASWARSCAPAGPGCAQPRWGWPIGESGGFRVCAEKRSPSSPTSV